MNFIVSRFFPSVTRFLGYLILTIGVVALYTNGIQVIFIPLIGFAIAFSTKGVVIDIANHQLKEYNNFFFIKFGKWQSLSQFPYITVLEIIEKTSIGSHATLVNSSSRQLVYRVTLLSKDHYKKLLLQQLKSKEKAHKETDKIADFLGLTKVIFSPRSF
jgi:hypothetical protein